MQNNAFLTGQKHIYVLFKRLLSYVHEAFHNRQMLRNKQYKFNDLYLVNLAQLERRLLSLDCIIGLSLSLSFSSGFI